MTDASREIIEVLAQEADRADEEGSGWSYLVLQRMARCAQAIISSESKDKL